MKNLLVFTSMWIMVFAVGFKPVNFKPKKHTVITGHVTNHQLYPGSNIKIIVPDIAGYPETTYAGHVQNNGTFKVIIDLYIAQDVKLKQESISTSPIINSIIVHPGDSLNIDLDYKVIANVKFSGDAAKTNNDVHNYMANYGDYRSKYESTRLYNIHDPEQFKIAGKKMRDELMASLDEFIEKVHPNEETKSWIKNYINLNCYLSVESFRSSYNRSIGATPGKAALDKSYSDISPAVINEMFAARPFVSDSYRLLGLFSVIDNKADLLGKYDKSILERINKIAQENNNPLLRQLLLGSLMALTLNNNDPTDYNKNKDLLDTVITAPFIKEPLVKHYKLIAGNVKQTQKFTSSIMKNIAGTPAEQVINNIKNQNKGKVIYVDIWATWCGPCIAEMPNSQRLIEKYKGKNIAFAFLCVDSKKELWEKVAPTLNVTGSQVFCNEKQSKSLSKIFKAYAIPFYILIDKNGEVTDANNNIRPADPLTLHKIDNLL